MGHYWNALSRGYLEFYGETVAGWYDLPGPIEAYFEDPAPQERVQPDWGLLARDCSALADAEVDFATVDGINLQFNVKFGAAWGGSSVLALDGEPRTFGVTWMPTWSSQSVYGHEIGHTFGLPHSSGPYEQTYDSRWDVMSDGNTVWDDQLQTAIGQHTIAFHRELLGWDPQGRIFVADRFGVSDTVALEFWNQEGGAGWSTIKIPLYNGIHYTAEARRQAGYDSGIPFRTVVLHHVDPGREDRRAQVVDADGNGNPNDAGAAWAPGETFRDGAQGVHLEVLEELTGRPGVDEGFLVAVTRGWWLDLILEGEGRVFSLVRDLECTASCSRLLVSRGPMLLQAEAGDGLAFAGWDGSCAGGGDCELTPSGRDSVVARFAEPLVILSDPHRPDATLGAWYEDELEFSGGTGITTWRMAGGAPPRGVGLDSLGGVLRGIPEESGDFEFLLTASSGALSSRDAFHLSVNRPEVSLREAIGELLERGSLLTLDETRFLDLVGNGNGRFDVGDVLLFRKNGGRP
jgi:M6 family metalloprotease-like protein